MPDFVVTTGDDGGRGSFRDAIEQANGAGSNCKIRFQIGAGPLTLRPNGPLPTIGFSGEIDAKSQPGYAGTPIIELCGSTASNCAHTDETPVCGLDVAASGLLIEGLAVTRWSGDAVFIHDGAENVIQGCYFGVELDGVTAAGNGGTGIHITRSVKNRIGGIGPGCGVVTSGNAGRGIWLEYGGDETQIWGSFIGTDRSGTIAVPNGESGVAVRQSAKVRIGGPSAAHRNVLSGNQHYGLGIVGPDSHGATVVGNYIGVDVTGTASLPNQRSGVLLFNVPDCLIGGSSQGDRNVISGNARGGINVDGCLIASGEPVEHGGLGYSNNVVVQGNFIGSDYSGTLAVPNKLRGVLLNYCQRNLLVDNLISGNGEDGVLVLGPKAEDADVLLVPADNRILRNRIGVSVNGAEPMGNGRHGILVQHGRRNVIGGIDAADANIIRYNCKRGVTFRGNGFDTNELRSNVIGDNGLSAFYQAP